MKTQRAFWKIAVVLALVIVAGEWPGGLRAASPLAANDEAQARQKLAHRSRRVIFNNDGCDVLYYPTNEAVTLTNFLAKRTTPLVGSQVDTISYCSISSGFSFFTHKTKVGRLLDRQGVNYGLQSSKRNIARDLVEQGTDCLQAMVDFAHQNKMECFWSMRMNDTHDAAHSAQNPFLLYPPLKVEHPDWLVGDMVKHTPIGRWSSVDYARAEVRDLAFKFIEEVCQNYDVDGVELDYFRHPCFFKSVANGGKASQAERDLVTDLMRQVRAMAIAEGRKRGRPILLLVRATDSLEFNRDLGLDVERWMQEGLFDMYAMSCYFRLNRWEESVALGHKYGLPVYPCLSDSRVTGENRFRRSSPQSYRGQALEAWAAGADGIHIFNLFDPKSPVFRETGDPKALATMDKLYFVTVRDGLPDRWLKGGAKYNHLPLLTPTAPKGILAGRPVSLELVVGDDLAAGPQPKVTAHFWMPTLPEPNGILVKFNGHETKTGALVKGWLDVDVDAAWVKKGLNQVDVALNAPALAASEKWSVVYDAKKLPASPWASDTKSERTSAKLVDGALVIADRGTNGGDYLYYRFPWGADPAGHSVVEARVKVISGLSRVIICNGVGQERLNLYPDHIELWSKPSVRYAMNTTDTFHVYRLVTQGKDVKVFVDDQLRLEAAGTYVKTASGRNSVAFGASDSTGLGEAAWQSVRTRVDSQSVQDFVLEVSFGKP